VLVEMVQFILKLLLKQIIFAVLFGGQIDHELCCK